VTQIVPSEVFNTCHRRKALYQAAVLTCTTGLPLNVNTTAGRERQQCRDQRSLARRQSVAQRPLSGHSKFGLKPVS
jgi:hypothetical protein